MVLVILALVWAAVLIPPALRARAENRPSDSILAFHRQLGTLRRTGPRDELAGGSDVAASLASLARHRPPTYAAQHHWVPPHVSDRRPLSPTARRRRRDVLVGLSTAAGATLVLGMLPSLRWLLVVHVMTLALLGGYVALLVRHRNRAMEQASKVRFLSRGSRGWSDDGWFDRESAWMAN